MITAPQPTNVFNIFLELTKIPRGSGNTKAVSDYCVNFAKKMDFGISRTVQIM